MWIFPKIVGVPPKSSILIGFSTIFTIHFGVPLVFGNTHIVYSCSTPEKPNHLLESSNRVVILACRRGKACHFAHLYAHLFEGVHPMESRIKIQVLEGAETTSKIITIPSGVYISTR